MRLMRLSFNRRECRPLLVILLIALAAGAQSAAPQIAPRPPVQLEVDASQIARRILHSRLTLSVSPGPLHWSIPGGFRASTGRPGRSRMLPV